MNVFATSECPVESAQHHCNTHNVKMIVELAQLLSTAHHELDGCIVGYKPTHKNHPNAKWVRETRMNYRWAYNHFKALCDEYIFRTGKVHKSSELLGVLMVAPINIPKGELTPFAMAMPDEIKIRAMKESPLAIATTAYRMYLNEKYKDWATRTDKRLIIADWGIRGKPDWVVM